MIDFDHERLVERASGLIIDRPGRVVLAFLLVTSVFAVGLSNVSTEAGTSQFASGIPAEEALSDVQREFGPSFAADTGSTQLIQRNRNVLSKPAMLRMLRTQQRLEEREDLRVTDTSSAAGIVARTIDPSARTTTAQIRALERATPAEVHRAVQDNADNPAFTGTVSSDFNRESASASATIGVVTHELPAGLSSGAAAGQGGTSPLTSIQQRVERVVASGEGDITVFGSGILAAEFSQVIVDSLLIVTPAAVAFIVFFLVVAYRDLLDLLLGTLTLLMAVVWTFGFLGLAGIPFNQVMIAVPPLLLAVGIDFGIHVVNRYREDRRTRGVDGAMMETTNQLLVAFFIVTGTTVIGFLSNLVSDLAPIRDFGIVAAVGIVFTFLLFGVFLPAAKVWVDRRRDVIPVPTFSQEPLGAEGTRLGSALAGGVTIARVAPALFLVAMLAGSASAGVYATGVDTSFAQEDFLPPEDTPAYLEALPELFAPADYSVVATLNFLEDNFRSTNDGQVTVYVEGRLQRDTALEEIHRMGDDPPNSFASERRRAESTSIVTVVRSHAERSPEFRRLVARNDRDGNGIPDDNLGEVYDALFASSAGDRASQYLSEDRRSARVVYTTKASASQGEVTADARDTADRFRGDATATGNTVVFKAVSDLIFESAIRSLALALALTVVFLVLVYRLLVGYASLGIANTVPILVAVAGVAATMRLAGISFNAFTATILALTIGLGIDYSVHVTHRFVDERRDHGLFPALDRTVRGTGGALAGSMLTTTSGIGVLVLAILSVLGQFGTLTAVSILYSFLTSLFVLPSALVVWDRALGFDPDRPLPGPSTAGSGSNAGGDGGEVVTPEAVE